MSNPKSQERLIVVPYKPGLKFRQRMTAWLAVLIGMAGGFLIGAAAFYLRYQDFVKDHREILAQLEEAKQQEEAMRQQVINYERGRAIDQKAASDVQDTIQRLEQQITRLKEDVAFYKTILAPSENRKGLTIRKWEVEPIRDRRYRYKLVLAQMAENKDAVQGIAAISFIGRRGTVEDIVPLRDLAELRDLGIKFDFRYFQELTGELTLPEDFDPEQVQVVVQSKGKNATKFEQTFLWKREERKSNVGKKQAQS